MLCGPAYEKKGFHSGIWDSDIGSSSAYHFQDHSKHHHPTGKRGKSMEASHKRLWGPDMKGRHINSALLQVAQIQSFNNS